jgi:hypothetical protein
VSLDQESIPEGGRKPILGLQIDINTTHYSQVETYRLRKMVQSITEPYAHKMPALQVVGEEKVC